MANSLARIEFDDVTVENHGSTVLVRWHTQRARDWIAENVQPDAQFFGQALVVEPRFVENLIDGMIADGLEVAQ